MKITVINGSPRKKGNTEIMVDAFVRGAQEAGHEVAVFSLAGREIHGCIGCGYCGSHGGHCVYKNGVTEIIDSTNEADMVVFASPIYWNFLTGQLTTVINRLHSYDGGCFHFKKAALLLNAIVDYTFRLSSEWFQEACDYQGWENMGISPSVVWRKRAAWLLTPNYQRFMNLEETYSTKNPLPGEARDFWRRVRDSNSRWIAPSPVFKTCGQHLDF